MKEEARQRTGEEHVVRGNKCKVSGAGTRCIYLATHRHGWGRGGKEGCEISATPVQTRNAVSVTAESVLSQPKAQVLSLGRPGSDLNYIVLTV